MLVMEAREMIVLSVMSWRKYLFVTYGISHKELKRLINLLDLMVAAIFLKYGFKRDFKVYETDRVQDNPELDQLHSEESSRTMLNGQLVSNPFLSNH